MKDEILQISKAITVFFIFFVVHLNLWPKKLNAANRRTKSPETEKTLEIKAKIHPNEDHLLRLNDPKPTEIDPKVITENPLTKNGGPEANKDEIHHQRETPINTDTRRMKDTKQTSEIKINTVRWRTG